LKRIWMIAGAVALATASALPWAVGYVTEYQWRQAVTGVNSSQPFLHLETERYERGMLGARVYLAAILSVPERRESVRISFHGDVTHGLTGSLMVLEPEAGWAPEGSNWFPSGAPRLTLESRVWGSALLKLTIPEARMQDGRTGDRLDMAAGEAWLRAGGGGSELEVFMTLPLLEVSGPEVNISVSGIDMAHSMEYLTEGLWTGTGRLNISRFTLQPDGSVPVSLSQLSLHTSTGASADRGRLDSGFSLTLEQVSVPGGSYGPHHVEVLVQGIDVASGSRLSAALADLQTLDRDGASEWDVAAEARAAEALMAAVREVALSGFTLSVPRISLATPDGEIRALAGIQHPRLSADERRGTLLVMPQLTGNLDLSLPLALAESDPVLWMQLAPLVKQGLLVPAGDRLEVEAQLQDMVMTVNGQEFPLPPVF